MQLREGLTDLVAWWRSEQEGAAQPMSKVAAAAEKAAAAAKSASGAAVEGASS